MSSKLSIIEKKGTASPKKRFLEINYALGSNGWTE
jgi:hypothetical protein